jgi:hypothetical protein
MEWITDTYHQRSSTDRSMSDTSGGTAPNGFNAGGRSSASAGSAGMVMTFSTAHRSPSRCHSHTDAERSSTLITTPTKPYVLVGSCAGRSSSTIWWASPRSTRWVSVRSDMLQKFKWCPNFRPSRSSGFNPPSIIDGEAHSDVITVSCRRCHHTSYAKYCGPRSRSHGPITSKVSWSSSATPPGPSSPFGPPSADMKMPPGPQCTVCGRE